MKRKLALLLAFAMAFSILPMTAAASNPPWGGSSRTGLMIEPNVPNNVRHIQGGSWVGNQLGLNPINAWAHPDTPGVVHNASGALRHIGLAADYFQGHAAVNATYFQANLANAQWLGSGAAAAPNLPTVGMPFPVYWNGSFIGRAFVAPLKSWGFQWTNIQDIAGVVQFTNALSLTSGADSVPALANSFAGNYVSHNAIGEMHPGTIFLAQGSNVSMQAAAAAAANGMVIVQSVQGGGVAWIRAGTSTNPSDYNNDVANAPSGSALSPSFTPEAPSGSDWATTSVALNPIEAGRFANRVWFGNATGNTNAAQSVAVFVQQALAHNVYALSIVDGTNGTSANAGPLMGWIVRTNAPGGVANTQAYVNFVRWNNNDVDPTNFLRLPIEYRTNPSANDNPISMSYVTRTDWSTLAPVTLATVVESSFTFGAFGTGSPRRFHSHQTVIVGGTAGNDGIRIAEAALGAFNRNDWLVEMEIITPGFRWSNNTVNTTHPNFISNNVRNRHIGGGVGNPTLREIRLFPTTGNENTRNRTIAFIMDVPNGAVTGNRMTEDWIVFSNMEIVANSGARTGNVEVEVRIGAPVQGGGTTTTNPMNWALTSGGIVGLPTTPAQATVWPSLINVQVPGASAGRTFNQPPVAGDVSMTLFATWNGTAWSNINSTLNPGGFTTVNVPGADVTNPTTNERRVAVGFATINTIGSGVVGDWRFVTNTMTSGRFVAAIHGSVGLELVRHANDDVNDFQLRSGMYEWDRVGAENSADWQRGYVAFSNPPTNTDTNIDEQYHGTARAILRETVPGSLPATGAHPTIISFNEGIDILGVRLSTNGTAGGPGGTSGVQWLARDYNLGTAVGHSTHANSANGLVLYGEARPGENFLNATIQGNSLTIRPYIGTTAQQRFTPAEIGFEFYLAIQPGFEHLYGDEIVMYVSSGTVAEPFEGELVIAYAWDPIIVDTNQITIDDVEPAAFGLVRTADISPITITTTEDNVLVAGDTVWVGVEGGLSRSWGRADHISLGAGSVTFNGSSNVVLSAPRLDSHGVYVTVLSGSSNAGDSLTFNNVQISGGLLTGQTYNVFVAGNAVAANWDGFNWFQTGGALGRGATHGFFGDEPYATPAFAFEGADIALGSPAPQAPQAPPTPQAPQTPVGGPRVIQQNVPFPITGGQAVFPPFQMIDTYGDGANASAFVVATVIGEILGWARRSEGTSPNLRGIFTTPDGREIVFTQGQSTFTVNGQTQQMVNTAGTPIAAQIGGADRFIIPIRVFNDILGAGTVQFQPGGTPGAFSIVVNP